MTIGNKDCDVDVNCDVDDGDDNEADVKMHLKAWLVAL